MNHCIFCNIINDSTIPKIYDDGKVISLYDNQPIAPIHILIIPYKHIATINDLNDQEDEIIIGQLYSTAKKLAFELKISISGYRTIINCNKDAGQTIFHLHLHLLAGRIFSWPPG